MDAAAARALFQDGQLLQAKRAYTELLEVTPPADIEAQAALLLGRAEAQLSLKLYRGCVQDCNTVLDGQPNSLEVWWCAYACCLPGLLALVDCLALLTAWQVTAPAPEVVVISEAGDF
jgi:hypothetical protein